MRTGLKFIQSDSRRRIKILGGDTIGHREKNFMWTLLMFTEIQQLSESTNTKALWMLIKKEKLITVNFILIQCLNKKYAAKIRQTCYSLQEVFENPTVKISALCNSCAKMACFSQRLSSRFFMREAASKCERAIRLVRPPFLRKLRNP